MKKNGTRWNKLTLVDNQDRKDALQGNAEDAAVDDWKSGFAEEGALSAPETGALESPGVLVFALVSVACAAAAIAAGSYALWLTRRRAAQNALTDVRDILKTCQERMVQLESDLNRLPQGFSSSPAA